jgi:hypothetical protein
MESGVVGLPSSAGAGRWLQRRIAALAYVGWWNYEVARWVTSHAEVCEPV